MSLSRKAPTLIHVCVVDACAGHERQAICAAQFQASRVGLELYGVLLHDPIVFRYVLSGVGDERQSGRASAHCELECTRKFAPRSAQFSPDGTMLLIGDEHGVVMYELSTGQALWSHSVDWRELFVSELNTVYWITDDNLVVCTLDARSGAVLKLDDRYAKKLDRVRISGALSEGELQLMPVDYGRVFAKKVAGEKMFLSIALNGVVQDVFERSETAGLWGARKQKPGSAPPMRGRAVGLLNNGESIVCVQDWMRGRLAVINARTGAVEQEYSVPIEQAEGLTVGTVSVDEKMLGIGTSLGRVIVLAVE